MGYSTFLFLVLSDQELCIMQKFALSLLLAEVGQIKITLPTEYLTLQITYSALLNAVKQKIPKASTLFIYYILAPLVIVR